MTREATIILGMDELRAVVGYAVACTLPVLPIFAAHRPDDTRPLEAVEHAKAFVEGAKRNKLLRDSAWAALRAAKQAAEAGDLAAGEVARAASAAAGAAYLHPLADATQVKHILGSAAHAARAIELSGMAAEPRLPMFQTPVPPLVTSVLRRYPPAPPGGGRVGELMRELDRRIR